MNDVTPHSISPRARVESVLARALLRLPPGVLGALAAGLPVNPLARTTLEPGFRFLVGMLALRPAIHAGGTAVARRGYADIIAMFSPPPCPTVHESDLWLPRPEGQAGPRIFARLYDPYGGSRPGPGIVYFHGGGFTIGRAHDYDDVCRAIANQTGAVVINVDYRLAPEGPAPAASDDALAAFTHVAENAARYRIDPKRIAVMGDSAGGNLSAVVSQLAVARGGVKPALQVLVYPATDMSRDYPSEDEFAKGFGLEKTTIDWFHENYLSGDVGADDPRVSPLLREDLSGLPPAIVAVASDPLRDEGLAYAKRLREANVPVMLLDFPEIIHGFFPMLAAVPAASRAGAEILAATRSALRPR